MPLLTTPPSLTECGYSEHGPAHYAPHLDLAMATLYYAPPTPCYDLPTLYYAPHLDLAITYLLSTTPPRTLTRSSAVMILKAAVIWLTCSDNTRR